MSTRTVTDRARRRCGAVLLCIVLGLGLAPRTLPAAPPTGATTLEGVVIARTEYRIEAVPGEITWTAATRLDITGQGLDRLTAVVPADLQIIRITGDGLASWKSQTSRGRRPKQTVELQFDHPLSGEREILLSGLLTHPPDQPWSVPPLVIDGADAHVGRARLVCAEEHDLALEDLDGARSVFDEATSPGLVFDLWRKDFRLEFTTREKDHSVRADLLTHLAVAGDRIELSAVAEIRPLHAPLLELHVAVPAGWQACETRLDERLVVSHRLSEQDGECKLRIPLPEAVPPGRTVQLELRTSLPVPETGEPSCELLLPEVRLPQAGQVRGRYVVDRSGESEMDVTNLIGLRPIAKHEFGESLCFEHDARPIAGMLRVTARQPVPAPPASDFSVAAPDAAIAADDVTPVPTAVAVVGHVRISSKLDAGGRVRHRADYVVPAEVSSLLVRLPDSATLWHALIDDKPLLVRHHGDAVEVRLPVPVADQTERTVSIVYQDEYAPLADSGTLQLEPLAARAIDRHGNESDLQVVEQHWSIQPPPGVLLYETRGAFRPVDPLPSSSWLAAAVQEMSSPAGAISAGLLLAAVIAVARARAPRRRWRIAAAATLVIVAAGLFASARPVLGGAASQHRSLEGIATPAPAGTLFRAILPYAEAALSVPYTTRIHSITARCAAAAGVAFLLWLLRRRGTTFRAVLAAAGLAGPVAALPFIEAAHHVWLDGVVLGTLVALLLWQVRPMTLPQVRTVPALTRSAAALLIFAALAASARAEDPSSAIRAESTLTVRIADEGVHIHGRYDLNAVSGSLDEFSFSLPESLKVRAVAGPNVAGWDVQRDTEPGRLVVRFDKRARNSTSIEVEIFQATAFPEGTTAWDLPAFHPLHLTSHRGTLLVQAADHLRVAVANAQGLRRVDPSLGGDKLAACHPRACAEASRQLASTSRGVEPSLTWALTGGDVALTLDVARHIYQCEVLAGHSAFVEPERLRLPSHFRVAHPGAPSLRFTVFVPEGCRTADVRAPNLARWSFDEGLLTVWFDRPQSGTVDVELDLEASLQPDASGVEIAVPLPLDASRVRSELGVWVHGSFEPSVDEGALAGWTASNSNTACDGLIEHDGEPPLLVVANDSFEPLPVVIALKHRETVAPAEPEPIAGTNAEPQPEPEEATPEALVEMARLSAAVQPDGTYRIEACYRVRNRERRFLPVLLPAEMRLLAAEVDGRAVIPVRTTGENSASILVPLADRTRSLAEVGLLLEARLPRALTAASGFFTRDRIELPVPQIPTAEADPRHGVPVVCTLWSVWVPNSLRMGAAERAAAVASLGEQLVVEESGSPAFLRLTVGPASPVGPAPLIAGALLAAGVWTVVRNPRRQQSVLPRPEQAAAEPPPTIAALPHESGIFSATRRAAEPGRFQQPL